MLQSPSHLSRVCGHGHIKKFWLMQTQKESQACESQNSFPNTTSVKSLDSTPRNPPSPVVHGHGEAGTSVKHSSFSCAETLSPPRCVSNISRPHSPLSAGDTLKPTDRSSNSDSISRTIDQETHPCTPSPRSYPLNVAFEFEGKSQHGLDLTSTRADPADSSHAEGLQRSEDSHSTSEGEMSHSYGSDAHVQPTRAKVKLMEPPSKSASATTSALVLETRKGHAVGSTSHYSDTELQHQALNSGLKACTLCRTTKTPMWRSGPQGPKSLCNACGIRFKKYSSSPGQIEPLYYAITPSAHHDSPKSLARPLKRKHNPVLLTGEPPRPQKMCSKSLVPGIALRQEKKNKWLQAVVARKEQGEVKEGKINSSSVWNMSAAPASFKKIYGCFPFHSKFKKLASINKHHSLNNVFAKDEEEAAVLLMHLSCGLVY